MIFIIGSLNHDFAELLSQDSPNYFLMISPSGLLDESNEIYINKCMEMAQNNSHVIIPIDINQLSPYMYYYYYFSSCCCSSS